MPKIFREKFQGCLLGLAAADAVGTTVEFEPPGSFEPVTDMTGGGPFNLNPGEWTDDTSMALCLAESLIECKGFSPEDQMDRYIRWFKDGHLGSNGKCFDIGITTRKALNRYSETGDPYSGSTDSRSAGNGSIMRLAPVPMFYARDAKKAIENSAESSRTTHGALACLDACRLFSALIVGALTEVDKDKLLSANYCPVSVDNYWSQYPLCPEIAEISKGSFKRKEPPEIQGSGYVVKSLEAALWAFYKTDTYKDGCLLAVNLGDDADTTAAVYGQLAGAFYGVEGIPAPWLEKLALRDTIYSFSNRLYELAQNEV